MPQPGKTLLNVEKAISRDASYAGLPPPWLSLIDAPKWLQGRYGQSSVGTIVDLVLAVRSGLVDHRLSEWLSKTQRWAFSDFLSSQRRQAIPAWLRFADAHDRVCVLNWEDAHFEILDCSVLSWNGHRCLIQIEWPQLEKWSGDHAVKTETFTGAEQLDVSGMPASGPDELENSFRPLTRKNVDAWMLERIATWPSDEPAPNEQTDFVAARAIFGLKFSRDKWFRPMRQNVAIPEAWRKQGKKRPPWGKVK